MPIMEFTTFAREKGEKRKDDRVLREDCRFKM
jgi:hypothetical protein